MIVYKKRPEFSYGVGQWSYHVLYFDTKFTQQIKDKIIDDSFDEFGHSERYYGVKIVPLRMNRLSKTDRAKLVVQVKQLKQSAEEHKNRAKQLSIYLGI